MKFVANAWYVAARAHEIGNGPLGRRVCGEPLVMFRGRDGKIAVMEDRCPHRQAPLAPGEVVDGEIQCPYHGLRLDTQGKCTWGPLQGKEPPNLSVRTYPTVEAFGLVFVWTGDPALAEPEKLPPWAMTDEAGWTQDHGYHRVRGNYQLVVDNLLDLTHLAFVHINTLGTLGNVKDAFLRPERVWVEGDVIHTERLTSETPSPYAADWIAEQPGNPEPIFQRATFSEFHIPSFVTVGFSVTRCDISNEKHFSHYILNAATPETETSCHYFWSIVRPENVKPAELWEHNHDLVRRAFDEDQAMIQSQQERLSENSRGQALVNLPGDKASLLCRRAVDRLWKAEQAVGDDEPALRLSAADA